MWTQTFDPSCKANQTETNMVFVLGFCGFEKDTDDQSNTPCIFEDLGITGGFWEVVSKVCYQWG